MSIELVMPSNHLILCFPLLLLPSIFPSIRVFSNKSALHTRGAKYWTFSLNISPSYDLSQIPYDYTVEMTNRFKGLDLIECLRTMDWGSWHCTGVSDQDHSQEKEMQKGKRVVWQGLTNKNRSESQTRKGKIHPFECRVPKNSKER